MGQRHQLYVIAKADGRYRTLAALHKQWGYGMGAIRRCQLVMQVFRANASIVRQEIQKAEKLDWAKEVEAEGVKVREMNVLFPIVSTCLVVAGGDKWLEPISILPTQGDNNDGITVFDITDPSNPRYAFVSLPESSHGHFVRRMTPMDATKYLKLYRRQAEDEQDHITPEDEAITKEVASFPLIDAATLQSAWPTLKFHERLSGMLKRSKPADSKHGGSSIETGSLRGKTMREVITKGVECDPSELSWIEEASNLPDFMPTLRRTLLEQPQLLEKPSGIQLLKRSLEGTSEVDLTEFPMLRPAQALEIVQTMANNAIVSLPSMPGLTLNDLENLLNTNKLHELHLGNTPNLGLQEALDALSGKPLAAFTHPILYRLPIELMYISPDRWDQVLPKYPAAFQSGFPVSQLIFMQHMEYPDHVRPRLEDGNGLDWIKTLRTESDGKPMLNDMAGPVVIPITLRDSLLTLDGLLEQLPGIVAAFSSKLIFDFQTFIELSKVGQDVATKHLALRVSSQPQPFGWRSLTDIQNDKRVLPIPARLYNAYRTYGTTSCEEKPKTEAIKRGEWSLLALHEASYTTENFAIVDSKLRYAFVTLGDDGQLVSLPVDDFVRTLSSSDVYGPKDPETRTDLVSSFEKRMAGTCKDGMAQVSHIGMPETIEAVRLADMQRAQVEDVHPMQAKMRAAKRKQWFEE
ncbi:hypothetical protein PRZ48_011519 [Zasmidium cellare]|uniref:Uncharacterized protein n=1 Tax=Zasmidium cellare TaxID=395010 RepID=A0ABR0E6S5_ZASCE|nr:hypothetical protein PRZ48_011519 [Zasmidium cellare]